MNGGGTNFDRTPENLAAAQVDASGETLRVLIEADGRHVLHTFKQDGYASAAWEKLVTWRGQRRGAKRAAVDGQLGYVSERREMILDPEFVAKGWQIGSGPTESCGTTLTQRLKGSGMRWDAENAEAIMALESRRESGRWKTYWQNLLPKTTS